MAKKLDKSPESLAWIAGFFDGEGCVGTLKPYQDSRARLVRVTIAQTVREPLDDLVPLFGGSVCTQKRGNERYKTLYQWKISAKKAEVFLRAIQPYVRVKAAQLKKALEIRDLINNRSNNGGVGPEPVDRFVRITELALEISGLNGNQNKNRMIPASWEVR